ncbi:hypothetical protein SEA_LASTRESORT_84 [Gordonia phage LastResort]|uniref:hypothetical protein n=1 Tax=Gordonia phage JSwag TaxID=1887649 RepID=UPI00084F2B06|nr:hypothetical protein BIZ70_gp027 [Gordonia phage JSwag]AXH47881.1 hypothetical protein SEA_LASTRESORT_84 [Gordonia phage LastResort]QDM56260.1 hypothetical protein SEA_REMO_84 [Gordonia phage ReMo]UAJ15574.1 hypothetical protein SEA_BOOHOO_85 [Gordonia Phage Boohoo]UVD39832.1 hypothetical protein SEA_ANAYSIA_86 [Gordonia phage Anaysia]WKW87396.1 hypothetical protein SEA_NEBULOSUS_83 [Gordonia phage Nebulosus]
MTTHTPPVVPVPSNLVTKYGEVVQAQTMVKRDEGTAHVTSAKVPGWRGAHRRWVTSYYPTAELMLEFKAINYFDETETVTTRWRINAQQD